jgi:hypothetical protein
MILAVDEVEEEVGGEEEEVVLVLVRVRVKDAVAVMMLGIKGAMLDLLMLMVMVPINSVRLCRVTYWTLRPSLLPLMPPSLWVSGEKGEKGEIIHPRGVAVVKEEEVVVVKEEEVVVGGGWIFWSTMLPG